MLMAYNKFTMAQLRNDYHLVITSQSALFADVPPTAISDLLRQVLARQTDLALQSGSEKARSEYLIAPILSEVLEHVRERANLFSGVEFVVDKKRGPTGYCDFIFTLAPRTVELLAPVISVVEAKKEDIPGGIPQCLAELVAAQIFNTAEERSVDTLYGVITSGEVWKFLRLEGTKVTIDTDDYFLNQPERLVVIILSMLN